MKKQKKCDKTCSSCIHEWACQAWTHGTIHEMDATHCAVYETVKGSSAYFTGYLETKKQYEKAIELMAEYIVKLGRVDYFLCDEIPKDIHLKYQPKNDGNYDNEPCQKCVAEYFLMKAGEQE